jgi:hypothetical protein
MTINTETFKKEYLELKRYGVFDKDIAEEMGVNIKTLIKYKRELGINRLYRTANQFGITEAHYRIADENGIPRLTAYARVANYDWPIEKAVTVPVLPLGKRRKAKDLLI